jgi:hypothetical protein
MYVEMARCRLGGRDTLSVFRTRSGFEYAKRPSNLCFVCKHNSQCMEKTPAPASCGRREMAQLLRNDAECSKDSAKSRHKKGILGRVGSPSDIPGPRDPSRIRTTVAYSIRGHMTSSWREPSRNAHLVKMSALLALQPQTLQYQGHTGEETTLLRNG